MGKDVAECRHGWRVLDRGRVMRRVLWLWSADGRFSRELVETGDFTEVKGACLRVGETWP